MGGIFRGGHHERPHSDVVKDIEKLLGKIDDELIKRHFKPAFKMKYINHTQYKIPYYTLTKDGFALLEMSNKIYAKKSKIGDIFSFNKQYKYLTKTKLSSIEKFDDLFSDFKNIFKKLSLVGRIVFVVYKIIQLLQLLI